MQDPGGNFEAQREAAVNAINYRVALDLLEYANSAMGSAAVASSEFSADWPAGGAINGDKTHINAGAPGAAENGVGGSVWQGTVVSGAGGVLGTPETLTISLGQTRKVNRLTLIFWPTDTKNGNLGAIAPQDFLIEMNPDAVGGPFTTWEGLKDRNAEVGKPNTVTVAGQVSDNVTDYNVFEDDTLQAVGQIRITFTKLQSVGVRTRVVEVEITRAVDLSEDVANINISRKKDYRLNRRLAGELNLTLRNFDRRYSPSYSPTVQELSGGGYGEGGYGGGPYGGDSSLVPFFNSEFRPNRQLRVFIGFGAGEKPTVGYGEGGYGEGSYGGGFKSAVQVFTGYIDRIEPDANGRLVMVKARDFFKYIIAKKITTNLKSSKTLEFLTEFLANLANFPSNLMVLDTSTIQPALYFPKDREILGEMQKLGDSTGDSEVYIDEFGRFFFRSYLNVVSHIFYVGSQASFNAGTLVNTTANDEPGVLRLTMTGPNFDSEGTWESALSPVLDAKVAFDTFLATFTTGPATSIDFFLRVTNDGGVTFTPYREIIAGTKIGKWNPAFSQVQIKARLRTSDPAASPKLYNVTVKYRARGGSAKTTDAAQFTFDAETTLLRLRQTLTDEVGGSNQIITKSTVKSTPLFLAAGAVTAWQGTVGGAFISASNPLQVAVGVTAIQADLGDTQYDVPQTLVATAGTAVFTSSISSHPTKPTITLTVTAAGTITDLKITGTPFVKRGTVEAITFADDAHIAEFGERADVLENDYIDNADLASDISKTTIRRFQDPLLWLPTAEVALTPNIQLNDRTRIKEPNTGLDQDFYTIGAQHELTVPQGEDATAKTTLELVNIEASTACLPAHWGGQFRFDGFRLGGCQDLTT